MRWKCWCTSDEWWEVYTVVAIDGDLVDDASEEGLSVELAFTASVADVLIAGADSVVVWGFPVGFTVPCGSYSIP